jgi:hypothetical protein
MYVKPDLVVGQDGKQLNRDHTHQLLHPSAYVSIRQHTSAYVSIRQHTSAYGSIQQHT